MRPKQVKKPSQQMKKNKTKTKTHKEKDSIMDISFELTPPPTPGRDITPPPTPGKNWDPTPPPSPEKEATPPKETWTTELCNGKLKITKKKPEEKEKPKEKTQKPEIIDHKKRRGKYIFNLKYSNNYAPWKEFRETAKEHPGEVKEYLDKLRVKSYRRYNDLIDKHAYLLKCKRK